MKTKKSTAPSRRVLAALGIALILAAIPSSLQLFYLPALYERSEDGEDVDLQAACATEAVKLLSPILHFKALGAHVTSWASHGYMHSWQYRWPWVVMYFANGLTWWCIILTVGFGIRRLRGFLPREASS